MTLHNDYQAQTNWHIPSIQPSLNANEVAVWRVSVDLTKEVTYLPLLSQDEQTRALKFHFAKDRKVSVVTRGILRTLIGRYLSHPPTTLKFAYSKFGKPSLASDPTLHFNVSHSGNLILLAFARDKAVGIDVEQYRPLPDLANIAKNFFSPLEHKMLFALPDADRLPAFFRLWSRKEAFIKERGEGLSHPLDSFDVSLSADNANLIATRNSDINPNDYTIKGKDVGKEYESAVAVASKNFQFKFLDWKEETN